MSAAATKFGSQPTYNFDFDVMVEKTGFSISVYDATASKYSQWETSVSENVVKLAGVAIAEIGEWASLRMVFYCGAEGGCVVELYKKAADGSYELLSGDLVRNSGSTNSTSNADALAGGLNPIGISPYSNATICLDNVAFYTTDAVYTPAE